MNRLQKMAWFTVIVTITAVVLSGLAVAIAYTKLGMPRALGGLGCMGIAGLAGFAPTIFRRDEDPVAFDERDRLFKKKANLAGFTAAYIFVGLTCMIPCLFLGLGQENSVRTIWLPMIFMGAGITHFFVYSLATLSQYGWISKQSDTENQ